MTRLLLLFLCCVFYACSDDQEPSWLKNADADFMNEMEVNASYPIKDLFQKIPIDEDLIDENFNRETTFRYEGKIGPFIILSTIWTQPTGSDIIILKKEKDRIFCTDRLSKAKEDSIYPSFEKIDQNTIYYTDNQPLNYIDIPYQSAVNFGPTCYKSAFRVYKNNKIFLNNQGKLEQDQILTTSHSLDPEPFDAAKIEPDYTDHDLDYAINDFFLMAAIADFSLQNKGPYTAQDLINLGKHIDKLYVEYKKSGNK